MILFVLLIVSLIFIIGVMYNLYKNLWKGKNPLCRKIFILSSIVGIVDIVFILFIMSVTIKCI